MEGSLFSQYHSGIVVRIFKLELHSHQALDLSVHRVFIAAKSSLPGINEDNSI
jgi:hypothetical protein